MLFFLRRNSQIPVLENNLFPNEPNHDNNIATHADDYNSPHGQKKQSWSFSELSRIGVTGYLTALIKK